LLERGTEVPDLVAAVVKSGKRSPKKLRKQGKKGEKAAKSVAKNF
jgi:hypothetical protein